MKIPQNYNIFQKHLNEKIENDKLYEGLIKTYPINDTLRGLNLLCKQKSFFSFISYQLRYDENNRSLPYIVIIFKKQNTECLSDINNFFNTCGWYIGDIVLNNGKSERDNIENVLEIKSISYIVFRAKYDIEIPKEKWPSYLYHISPFIYKDKILKNGLIPKSKGKLIKHEEHIYLFDLINDEELNNLLLQLDAARNKNKFEENSELYVVFQIDMKSLWSLTKIYTDPDLYNGYFTLNNIGPDSLKLLKIINVNDL